MAKDTESIDNTSFDRVMTLLFAFDENKKQDDLQIAWKDMKRELEKLTTTELEILLGLVKTKG